MLDIKKYYKDWQKRIEIYKEEGIYEDLITTDDLGGIDQEKIDRLIDDIRENTLQSNKYHKFSMHHYELY